MSFPIDPPRRSPPIRRMDKAASARPEDDEEGVLATETAHLPVPVGPARTIPPKGPVAGRATIEAQVIGERRGLRAGPTIHDQAKASYNGAAWSGSRDRRRPKGGSTKTEA